MLTSLSYCMQMQSKHVRNDHWETKNVSKTYPRQSVRKVTLFLTQSYFFLQFLFSGNQGWPTSAHSQISWQIQDTTTPHCTYIEKNVPSNNVQGDIQVKRSICQDIRPKEIAKIGDFVVSDPGTGGADSRLADDFTKTSLEEPGGEFGGGKRSHHVQKKLFHWFDPIPAIRTLFVWWGWPPGGHVGM